MSEQSILAPLDTANLFNLGLLGPGKSNGVQRLHKRRLNRSSDEENHDISLDVSILSPAADDAFAMIPTELISEETLIYVGFSEMKATELWSSWTAWPAQGPRRETDPDDGGLRMTFKDFITGAFNNLGDSTGDNPAEWRACLNGCGIAVDVQNAIMDAAFKYLRLSQSCIYWIKDTIEMRYAGLKDIQRTSRQREMQLQRAAARSGDAGDTVGIGGVGGRGNAGGQSNSSASISQAKRSVSGLQQQGVTGISLDVWDSTRAIAARNAPGHLVLFKGVDQGRIAGIFDEAGNVERITTLLSSPPSDFSGMRALFYFTPDLQVAERYAQYAKRRAGVESVVIVCLTIPNSAIESLQPPEKLNIYWPSDEWKELVWSCRTQSKLSPQLRKYRDATLVIGTISRKPDNNYHGMKWQDMTGAYLLRVGPRGHEKETVQYVFSGEEAGCEFLEENAQHIKVFPYPQSELEGWLAANPSNDERGEFI